MTEPAKNPHAVALGRLGGLIGGRVKSLAKTLASRQNARRPRPRVRCPQCNGKPTSILVQGDAAILYCPTCEQVVKP